MADETDEAGEVPAEGTADPAGFPLDLLIFAVLLVLGGLLGLAARFVLLGGVVHALQFLAEVGLPLPAATELVVSGALPGACMLVGLLGAGLTLGLGAMGHASGGRVAGSVALFLLTLVLLATVAGAVVPLRSVALVAPLPPRDPIPGRTSELAAEVEAAFRSSIERGVGVVETPSGPRRYLLLTPPGASPPSALPSYEDARQLPGCLVLPFGPEGNTQSADEVELLYPTGVAGGLDPGDLRPQRPPAWIVSFEAHATTIDGAAAVPYPATLPIGDPSEGYSYALRLKRARVDSDRAEPVSFASLMGGGFGGTGLEVKGETRIDLRDAFSDELLELRILVFRDFVAPPAGPQPIIQEAGIPIATFVTLVRVPGGSR